MNKKQLKTKLKILNKKQNTLDSKYHKETEQIETQKHILFEQFHKIKTGDKIQVARLLVRACHKDTDQENLGQTGIVIRVYKNTITCKLDNDKTNSSCDSYPIEYIEKI